MPENSENPWDRLPLQAPFLLPEDARLINEFNVNAADRFKVHFDIFPEPFLGNPNAPVVLLGLNPGFNELDIKQHKEARFAALSRANLLHQAPRTIHFICLTPR
jgi:hypothetical protein